MKTLNRATLLGNVASDVDTRTMPNGNNISQFSVATTNSWKDKDTGQWKDKGEFHRCICFAKLSDIVDEYVVKGMQIFVEGRIQTRSWEQDGVKRYNTEIIVSDFQMLGSKADSDKLRGAEQRSAPSQAPPGNFKDDDIPF